MSCCCHWKKLCNLPLAVLMLLVGGLVLQPLNRAVCQAQHRQGLQLPPPRIAQKDAFTQQLAFFTLGGLRSLAAELTSLDATNAWSNRDWPRADARWQTVTTLAPRRVNYWVAASRDMATNAAGDILSRDNLNRRDRTMQAHHYIQRGEDYLLSGLANRSLLRFPSSTRTVKKFIGGRPIKLATNIFPGLSYSSSGVPICCTWPMLMQTIRSASVSASV